MNDLQSLADRRTSTLSTEAFPPLSTCYAVDPLSDPRWPVLVERHPRASVFHSSKFLQALRTVYGYQPAVVTTCPPDAELTNGLALCKINSWVTGQRFVSLPFSDHCEPLVNSADECDDMLVHLEQQLKQDGLKYVEIRPVSYTPSIRTKFGTSVTYCFHRLDLCRSAQELFRAFHKDCIQRKIRRAERENLKYEAGTSENLLQEFYKLLVLTRRRQYLPPQPLNWFRGLIAAFGNDLKIRVAFKDDMAVAGILTLSHKKTMVYKYGCSDAAANKFGGVALLFWRTIQEAQENGLEVFDLGRSNTDNRGLVAFKEHWGATGSLLTYWTYPYKPARHPSNWQKKLVKRIVSASPDLALEMAGTLLYRHIG